MLLQKKVYILCPLYTHVTSIL